jgi:hypothetical protein
LEIHTKKLKRTALLAAKQSGVDNQIDDKSKTRSGQLLLLQNKGRRIGLMISTAT